MPVSDDVGRFLDHLAVEKGSSRHTLTAYGRDLRRYADFLDRRGRGRIGEATTSDVREFLVSLRAGDEGRPPLAESSIARTLVATRGLHRFAAAEGLAADDVAHAVSPPTPPKRLPKALPVDDVLAILEASGGTAGSDDPQGLRNRALVELLYSCGARISEAIDLDVDDVDATQRSVVLRGKGGKERLVPVGGPALDALDAYLVRGRPVLNSRGQPALFLGARGGRLSRQSAWLVLRDAAERAGVTAEVSPHTMRHSFATHLLEGGADIRVVQELLGHASVTTTQIYTLVTVSALREVYALAHPRAR